MLIYLTAFLISMEYTPKSYIIGVVLIIAGLVLGMLFNDKIRYFISPKDYHTAKWQHTWRMYITKKRMMADIVFRLDHDSLVGSYMIYDEENKRYLTTKMVGLVQDDNLFSGTYFQYDNAKLIVIGKFIFGLNEKADKFIGSYFAYNLQKNIHYKKSNYWVGELIKN